MGGTAWATVIRRKPSIDESPSKAKVFGIWPLIDRIPKYLDFIFQMACPPLRKIDVLLTDLQSHEKTRFGTQGP